MFSFRYTTGDFHLRPRVVALGLCLLLSASVQADDTAPRSEAPSPLQQQALAAAREYRQAHGPAILRDFASLLAIPNVARDDENIRRNAQRIRDELTAREVSARLLEVEGAPPVVFGERNIPGAQRTLAFYVHYDGQPVDEARWTVPPWQPTLMSAALETGGEAIPFPEDGAPVDPEWRLYARSAGDDKAPLAALFGALDALEAADIEPTVNLKFFFEGEEEVGSPHLEQFITRYRELLDADLWLICDGPSHQSGAPQLVFGVRGYTGFDLTVYGANRYLHSGHYGNWAPNPAQELAQLLASLKNDQGRVLIDGFYDSTIPPGAAERAALDRLPVYDEELRRELDLAATEADNAPLLDRLLIPSLNVRGMVSGAIGDAARNVIPTEATASLDIRLAKGNDPVAMLDRVQAHLEGLGYHVVADEPDGATRRAHPRLVRMVRRIGYPATRTPLDEPQVRPVATAMTYAAGQEPLLVPTLGGSLPLYVFVQHLETPLVVLPIANHDNNQHGPDENLRLANLWLGIDIMATLITMP
ncbi:MAG: M20/M25/M40 family metallo-hydrolase [Acidobacteriota bacterium]|nr:M20/M25/M40 family metallo-hydrolase [Acidobacteriota bacterium]